MNIMNVTDYNEGFRVHRLHQQAEPADLLSGDHTVDHVLGLLRIGADCRDKRHAAFQLCGDQLGNLRSLVADNGEGFGGVGPS